MLATIYGTEDPRLLLGALTAAQALAACGRAPLTRNYTGDPESYRQDLADYEACVRSTPSTPASPVTPAPQPVVAHAAAPAPVAPAAPAGPPSDSTIADQALSWTHSIGMSASLYASWKSQIMSALSAGILDPGGQYATSTGKCAGASAPPGPNDVALAAQAAGASGAVLGVLAATNVIPIFGPAIAGVASVFLTLISKLFGPPVSQLEQQTLCPTVSAANAVLNQITGELKAGYMTSDQAKSAINELNSSFTQHVSSIEYIQTPNDTQFMLSALNALVIKNTASGGPYDQLGNSAKQQLAAQQEAQQAAQETEIQQAAQAAVTAALAKSSPPATVQTPATPVSATPAPASIAAGPAVTSTPSAPTTPAAAPASTLDSWFTGDVAIGSYQIPKWALWLGGGLLLLGAA